MSQIRVTFSDQLVLQIDVQVQGASATWTGDDLPLRDSGRPYDIAMCAIEATLLALATSGAIRQGPALQRAIDTVADVVVNKFGDD